MKTDRTRRSAFPLARASQAGAAAVELAIVIVLMFMIVAGIIEFGRAFWYADALTKATRDGARLMSAWPAATIQSKGVAQAIAVVRGASSAASVSPALGDANVVVECLNDTFSAVACTDGTAPRNVRVSINGMNLTLGGWMPFIGASGGSYGTVSLAPHTTMRYIIN